MHNTALLPQRAAEAADPGGPVSNAAGVLRARAFRSPDKLAFRIARFGDGPDEEITCGELDRRARGLAGRLQAELPDPKDSRALLALGFGLEYLTALFGCLYAGVVAVPAYAPKQNRLSSRLRGIAADARPAVVLGASGSLPALKSLLDGLLPAEACWLAMDTVNGEAAHRWVDPRTPADAIAYLQYTSGSTADPKGVMVTHRNVLHNVGVLSQRFAHAPDACGVSWLPLYHDMGLIGAVFQPLRDGFPITLMAPVSFLQRPYRWLEAISQYRATISGGPNFAYELCARAIGPEHRAKLDLSSWTHACCGAEPVRADTLDRFCRQFRPNGFHPGAWFPCYGLAEATLIVTGPQRRSAPAMACFAQASLVRHQVVACACEDRGRRRLVSCGAPLADIEVKIVDPDTARPLDPGRIGEIWVAGPSVTAGYWGRPADTEATFNAALAGATGGPFLRTGDLGFLWEGELFVTGRRKELIIIRGKNFYPQDIEATVANCHDALAGAVGCVFSVDDGADERLIVTQELNRKCDDADLQKIVTAIRQAVWEDHELQPEAVVLLKRLGVPRTSSGKIQRLACRDAFLAQTLPVVAQWTASPPPSSTPGPDAVCLPAFACRSDGPLTRLALRRRLVSRSAELLNLPPAEVDTRLPFGQYGLDSVKAVSLSAELGGWIGVDLPATLLWDHPTIDALSLYLATRAQERQAGPVAAAVPEPTAAPAGGATDPPHLASLDPTRGGGRP